MTRTVAIVGRPNVGKSALFNRLAGRKISIVHDQPGVTRDRLAADCKLGRNPFSVIDTGGIGSGVDATFSQQVHTEVDIAITSADVLLFLVDGQSGLTPVDEEIARQLRRTDKPLVLVVNKIDHNNHQALDAEFARLGFKDPLSISAEHNRGIGDLVDRLEALLPEFQAQEKTAKNPTAIAIVGRPNVGKSSLINAILKDRRTLVSNISGTTRDAIDVPYERKGVPYILIDTAGIRPRGKIDNSVEVFSVMRSERSIRRADLCVLVLDATAGVTAQDKKIAGMIQESEKPCVIAINKWDLVDAEDALAFVDEIKRSLFFLHYAPMFMLSAQTGEHLARLFRGIDAVRAASKNRITTGQLNRLLAQLLSEVPTPARGGKRFKILYGTQVEHGHETIPIPAFMLFVNYPELLPPTYRQYLETRIRQAVDFTGLPIHWILRGRERRGAD